jgi:L-fuculose-phosphate aldolase
VPHPADNAKDWHDQREAVLDAARKMFESGLVGGTAGNVSARCGKDLLAITATGVPYDTMTLDHVIVVDHEGEPVVGDAPPSTEMLLHVAIYRARPDVGAVMHTHSLYASALAATGASVPPIIDEMVVYLGDSIQVSEYAFPSTEELGERVVDALGERNAALIRNHGLVAVGRTPVEALRSCQIAERIAHIYTLARSLGTPQPLPPEAIEAEMEVFRMRKITEE